MAFSNLKYEDPWIRIEMASRDLAPHLPETMLRHGRKLPRGEFDVWYKCDHLRETGSYKERGALNALLRMPPEVRNQGAIAASAGNHAQALALWGQRLGVKVTVVMPVHSPLVKVSNCRALGAEVLLQGEDFGKAKEFAEKMAMETKMKYVNGYDDPDVIFGAGTCGLEILRQLKDVDAVIVPVGGGGLIAGVALAMKRMKPSVKIIGVESERCPSMTKALAAKKPVMTPLAAGGTLADGLAVTQVGNNAFELVTHFVDSVITVEEHFISMAIVHLLEKEKMLVEGAGCCGLAGILSGKLDYLQKKNVVIILCGGNIDLTVLGRVIERGLFSTGRLMQFDCAISDRVGGLARFCACLSKTGASVKEIVQERPYISDVNVCSVHLTVEVRDVTHGQKVIADMSDNHYTLLVCDDKKYDNIDLSKL